jgi:MFS transporter, Spinster family, sphingosine-1-phosphate transporter
MTTQPRPGIGVTTPKNYLLALLTMIFAFNYTDRFALGMAAQNIKSELNLSDAQLGFLSGIAFALFYALMGIPMARWADRGNRVRIISISTALWSTAVAVCGMAGSFVQLVLIRVVVGVGEAGCLPPSHSLIADFFTRAQRSRAMSVYMQGASASLVIGYFVAGWLNQFYGWRTMFLLIGLPGVALAILAQATLRDPRRAKLRLGVPISQSPPSVIAVCVALWGRPTFRHVLYAFSLTCFFSYGTTQWAPSYFMRSFGLQTGELGTWFAVIFGLSGVVGTYWGGEWTVRRALGDERRQLNWIALMICLSGLFSVFALFPGFSPNHYWAFAWLALSNGAAMTMNGPTFAVLQTLVPAHMRAMSVALLLLFINLVGVGCGPWLAGGLSDALRPWVGQDSLRYAMLLICPVSLWGAWHLWRAGRTVARDLTANDENATQGTALQQVGDRSVVPDGASFERPNR